MLSNGEVEYNERASGDGSNHGLDLGLARA